MKTYKTTAERLHAICLRAQSGKPHGLSGNRFALICARRGYRLVDTDSGLITIEPVAGLK
jgi:hypothetical protein